MRGGNAVKLSAGLAAALLCTTCLTGTARAQAVLGSEASVDDSGGGWGGGGALTLPPPIRLPADVNGVDLSTGAFTYSARELSIGSGVGELTYERAYLGGGWRDNHTGTINKDGSKYFVSLGLSSESFTLTGGTYVSDQGSGSTLTFDGTTYSYRSSRGVTATFAKALAGDSPTQANEGRVTAITYPSGLKLTYAYKQVTPATGVTAQRLQSVVNNLGYQLKFSYQAAAGAGSTTLTKVTGVNLAVDYCDPTADACSNFTVAWPSTTYAGNTVTDAANRVTTYGYADWMLTSIQSPGRAAVTIGYYPTGAVSTVSNGTGTWNYSFVTGSTAVIDPLNHWRELAVDSTNGLITSDKDPLGRTTTYTYDAQYRPKRVTGPDGGYTEVTYDTRGNIISSKRVAAPGSGLADIVTSATYDASCTNPIICNLPTATVDARGGQTDIEYDPVHGGVLKVTAPAGQNGVRPQTRYAYTALSASYKNSATTFQSGSAVQMVSSASTCATQASCAGTADETKTTLAYVNNNLLPTASTTAAGDASLSATTAVTYDAVGNLLTVDGPLAGTGDTTRYRYDALRRPVGMIGPDPDGAGALKPRATRVTYHANGQAISIEQGTVVDQSDTAWTGFTALQQRTADFDTAGRPTRSALVAGGTTYSLVQYAYDNADRLTCQTVRMNPAAFASAPDACTLGTAGVDGRDRITKYDYDNADQPTKITTGYGGAHPIIQVQATYDATTGRLATLADGKGNLTTYAYDGFGRLSKTRYPTAANGAVSSTTDYEQLTYDAASNVTQVRRRDGQTIALGYDALNHLVTGVGGVTYAYDNIGRMTSASLGGQTNSFGYDALGRNISQTGPLGTVGYQYDLAGRRTRITWPDALWVSYDYDPTGALTAVRENGASSGAGVLATFAYDDLGRRVTISRGNGVGTTYGYDPASRLTSLSHDLAGTANDVAYTFTYNAAFQIKTRAISNTAYEAAAPAVVDRAYNANGLNQTTTSGALSLSYDGRGNLTSDGVTSYGYDVANRLTSAAGATLSYDPLGRLSQVSSSASTTRFAYDGVNLIGEYNAAGTLLRRYIPGVGTDEPLAWYEGASTGTPRWLAADQLGSVVAVTNSSAGLVASAPNSYDEYGLPAAGNLGRFQYTGQTWLSEAGLYHYKARAYSPTLGRFMQPDPIGYADGMNLYAYAHGDPVNATDPTGLKIIQWRNPWGGQTTCNDAGPYSSPDHPGSGDCTWTDAPDMMMAVANIMDPSNGWDGGGGGGGGIGGFELPTLDEARCFAWNAGDALGKVGKWGTIGSLGAQGVGWGAVGVGAVTLQPEIVVGGGVVIMAGEAGAGFFSTVGTVGTVIKGLTGDIASAGGGFNSAMAEKGINSVGLPKQLGQIGSLGMDELQDMLGVSQSPCGPK